LDIFFLIPQNPIEEMRLFVTDQTAFQIYWLFITTPILLYLIVVGSIKLWESWVGLVMRFDKLIPTNPRFER
jgi:hypothetical protein